MSSCVIIISHFKLSMRKMLIELESVIKNTHVRNINLYHGRGELVVGCPTFPNFSRYVNTFSIQMFAQVFSVFLAHFSFLLSIFILQRIFKKYTKETGPSDIF